MKKLIFTLSMLMLTIAAWATNYSGTLTVTVNGESTSVESTISLVDNGGGSYTLSINNFMLDGIPVGNIVVTAPGTTANGLTSIVTSETIQIAAGDPTVSEEWMGPILGDVPINMVLAFNQYAMTTNIDIYMAQLEQNINVKFAQDGEQTGYQIKNSNFENFKSNGEPYAWHGFKSATGSFAGMAQGKLASSDDVRTGATGTKSAVVTSGSVLGIINNGTMTTGRLNAGNMSAANTANCSKMDMNAKDENGNTPVDANGDPYYTVMHGRPDAFTFWLKFSQGTAQTTYKYASMSAIITDGTTYQDPEDKTYTNKLATSKKTDITTCGWTQFTVPFDYIDKNVDGKALLVTFSTNATPGKGSSGDKVFVDDIALVYNAAITGIKVKGNDLEGFDPATYEYNFTLADGETFSDSDIDATYISEHAYLVKKVVATADGGYKLFVAVVSNDLTTTKVYTINYAPAPKRYFLTGTFNSWNEGDGMTELVYNEETGKYEADQAMGENAEFKLKDGEGVWYGAQSDGNFAITQQMVTNGDYITILKDGGNNMAIAVAGNWHFAYDAEQSQLVVTGEWVVPQPKVYIIGEVNGNSWATDAGVEMTYDETTDTYTSDVTVGSEGSYGYFCFSTKLTDKAGDWDGLAPYRLMPAPRGEGEGNFEITRDEYNTDIAIGSHVGAVRLPAGQYRLVVNGELNSMRVEAALYNISVDPVAEGVTVTVADKYDTVLSKAIEGETVYVKAVSADTGRAIVGIMVYDTDDNTVASQVFTHNASSVDWTFAMPAKDVVIKVETATVSSFAALNSTETAANENYVVSDPVAIAPYTLEKDGTVACMVSDNQGNYAMVVMGDGVQAPQGGLSAGFVVTKIANGALMLVSGQENAEMEYNIEKFALNNDNFEPADWQVFKLIGYFQMENGQPKVSAFSGKTAAGISTSYFLNTEMCPDFDAANFTVGEKYEFVGVLGFVEDDETLPEPVRRVLKGHADTARPIYLIDGTATISTGIDSIVKNVDAKSVRYFNVQGVELSEPVRGVNIVVIEHTDGSTTTHKVLK